MNLFKRVSWDDGQINEIGSGFQIVENQRRL